MRSPLPESVPPVRCPFLLVAVFGAGAALVACDVGAIPPHPDPALVGGDTRPLAGDVAVTDIAGYQAVRVPLVDAERAVPFANRRAKLVAGRDLLVRATVLRTGGKERPLVARLDLGKPGQRAAPYVEAPVLFAPGTQRADVRLEIAGPDLVDGAHYALSILEANGDTAGDSRRARWPRDAASFAQFEPRDSRALRVVVVPIAYNGVAAPQPNVGAMADLIQAFYPLGEGGVTVTAAPAISLTVSLTADPNSPYASMFPSGHPFWMSDEVFAELRALRAAAGTGAYYYGLIAHNELFGMAEAIPSPISYGTTNDGIVTMVHELGHNLGLRHAPCGGAGGPDPAFPYGGGLIGVEGYDPRSGTFLDEKRYHDFMSYCAPEWVSDYHFDKLHRTLSSVYALPPGAIQPDPVPCDFVTED